MEKVLCNELKTRAFLSMLISKQNPPINIMLYIAFVRFVNDGEIQQRFYRCNKFPKAKGGQNIVNTLLSCMENG